MSASATTVSAALSKCPHRAQSFSLAVSLAGDNRAPVVISPDGLRLAFGITTADGKSQLWIRSLDALAALPLAGTEGATFPFWSPDSRSIGFFAEGKLPSVFPSGVKKYGYCGFLVWVKGWGLPAPSERVTDVPAPDVWNTMYRPSGLQMGNPDLPSKVRRVMVSRTANGIPEEYRISRQFSPLSTNAVRGLRRPPYSLCAAWPSRCCSPVRQCTRTSAYLGSLVND